MMPYIKQSKNDIQNAIHGQGSAGTPMAMVTPSGMQTQLSNHVRSFDEANPPFEASKTPDVNGEQRVSSNTLHPNS